MDGVGRVNACVCEIERGYPSSNFITIVKGRLNNILHLTWGRELIYYYAYSLLWNDNLKLFGKPDLTL